MNISRRNLMLGMAAALPTCALAETLGSSGPLASALPNATEVLQASDASFSGELSVRFPGLYERLRRTGYLSSAAILINRTSLPVYALSIRWVTVDGQQHKRTFRRRLYQRVHFSTSETRRSFHSPVLGPGEAVVVTPLFSITARRYVAHYDTETKRRNALTRAWLRERQQAAPRAARMVTLAAARPAETKVLLEATTFLNGSVGVRAQAEQRFIRRVLKAERDEAQRLIKVAQARPTRSKPLDIALRQSIWLGKNPGNSRHRRYGKARTRLAVRALHFSNASGSDAALAAIKAFAV